VDTWEGSGADLEKRNRGGNAALEAASSAGVQGIVRLRSK